MMNRMINVRKVREDIRKGRVLTYDEVFGHPQPGFAVADKGKVVYKLKKAVGKAGVLFSVELPKHYEKN